jgi:mono/diheme cytochrome c family protein
VRANYLLACRGCHLADGSGVPPEVPSLRNTLGPLAATAEGRDYLVRVPAVLQSRLSDARLAEVLNWVLTEFNADTLPGDFKPLTASEVAAARKQILADPIGYRRARLSGNSLLQ